MSSNERVDRILRLISVLQSGRSHNSGQLARLCGVSRRTIFRDLATLQESGLRIVFDETRQGYSLAPQTYLPPTDFTLPEALALLVLCRELGDGDHGIPFLRAAQSAGLKLVGSLPQTMREYVGDVASAIAIRLDVRNRESPDPSRYEELVQALSQRRHVRIRYNSFSERKEIGTLLSPFRMLFRRRSWYVIGRSSLHRAIRTFNVGRITALELLETQYRIPPRFDLDRYLGDAWNLIREPDRPLAVRIRFSAIVASNVEEVRWHRTQRMERDPDGALVFCARVEGMREIVWWILGYGEQAEVLEPPELRAEVVRRIEAMRAMYDGRPAPPA